MLTHVIYSIPASGLRAGEERKMLYIHYTPETLNKCGKLQSIELGNTLVCKKETRSMGARHIKI